MEGPSLINCNGMRKGRELLSHHGCCEDALEKGKKCTDAAKARKLLKDIVPWEENLSTQQNKQTSPFSFAGSSC